MTPSYVLLLTVILLPIAFCESTRDEHDFTLTIVMGPLCSGKTSYIQKRVTRCGNSSRYAVLSVDAILDTFSEWTHASNYSDYRRLYGDQRLWDEFTRLVRWPRQHILYETTGADHAMNRMMLMVRRARTAGYRIDMRFHEVSPERVARCVRRRNRIQRRQVSPEDMKRIFFESRVNFVRLNKRMRHTHLFDSISVATR